ncbi:MAG: radical SAM/SPASM domain-containing protein [Desulfuromonadaceae bacterium]|nr:radical SAM/SPASM domain-containing protein [Desulfuromonadaceae bacterium]MDD5104194.1 radical SAM/SPASM domain-containing protein [Desulfuromonadaceae bacterium]
MIYLAYGCDPKNAAERTENILASLSNHEATSLFIEPSSACNLSCKFCDFHSNKTEPFRKQKGNMSMDTFNVIMENVRSLPFKFKVVYFNLHGEPLLNPKIVEMIRVAHENNIAERYSISTNGILLTDARLNELIRAGIDTFIISLDTAKRGKYASFKGSDKLDTVLDNIVNAIEVISSHKRKLSLQIKCTIQTGIHGISESDTDSVMLLFKKHAENSERIHIYFLNEFNWYTKSKEIILHADHRLCDLLFYQVAIHYDGIVSCCCIDTNYDMTLGKLTDSVSLKEMLNGEKLCKFRKIHLSGNLDPLPTCKYCENKPVTELTKFKDEVLRLI